MRSYWTITRHGHVGSEERTSAQTIQETQEGTVCICFLSGAMYECLCQITSSNSYIQNHTVSSFTNYLSHIRYTYLIYADVYITKFTGEISFAFTNDGWTSWAMETYLPLTAYYINKNFQANHYMLSSIHLKKIHTAVYLQVALLTSLSTWKLNTMNTRAFLWRIMAITL